MTQETRSSCRFFSAFWPYPSSMYVNCAFTAVCKSVDFVQLPKSHIPHIEEPVKDLARKCFTASRTIGLEYYDPVTINHAVKAYFDAVYTLLTRQTTLTSELVFLIEKTERKTSYTQKPCVLARFSGWIGKPRTRHLVRSLFACLAHVRSC